MFSVLFSACKGFITRPPNRSGGADRARFPSVRLTVFLWLFWGSLYSFANGEGFFYLVVWGT